MDNIQISKMTILDLESISNTLLSDFDDFWTISIFKSELQNPNSKYLVAKLNNQIVGFGGIWKSPDDIHITNIVVNKNFRRQNIGTIILSHLINLSKKENITSITLEVSSTNIPAQKLYEKLGFKKVGLRKKYYNNTNDAIIMTMEVSNEKK
ncbi:MAG: ribosomal protein S18-alanine N-acetyltransferase [Clostridia bacterium]|nr:ribosomal protein S18-alanine N-acetyltransferase [Clostridia bacterium]